MVNTEAKNCQTMDSHLEMVSIEYTDSETSLTIPIHGYSSYELPWENQGGQLAVGRTPGGIYEKSRK